MHSWIPPQLANADEHMRSLSWMEYCVFYLGKTPDDGSISGWWHWRGQIAKKLLGRMPTPDEVDVPADNAYWNEAFVDISEVRKFGGELVDTIYWRCGRRLKETSPYVRRYRESLSRS